MSPGSDICSRGPWAIVADRHGRQEGRACLSRRRRRARDQSWTDSSVLMVPGRLRSLLKMANPRRFADGQFSLPHRWFWTDDVTARAIGVDWPSRAVIDVETTCKTVHSVK